MAEAAHLEPGGLVLLVLLVRLGCFRVWRSMAKLEVVQVLKLRKT